MPHFEDTRKETSVRGPMLGLAMMLGGSPAFAVGETSQVNHPSQYDVLSIANMVQDDGASEHMVYAAKLRMLSQRIAAAACFAHFGIEQEASADLMRGATDLFNRLLDGLEHGDPELGLMKAETDRMILIDLQKTRDIWEPLNGLIYKISGGSSTDEEILLLADKGKALVEVTGHMSSVIMAEYSDPTILLQEDALLLEIAGRLPMMAQLMAKDMCMIVGNLNAEAHLEELVEARTLFENTVDALRFGMPAMGLEATTDPEILAALENVFASWNGIKPVFDALVNGEKVDMETEAVIFHAINALTDELDQIELMFSQASKMDL